MTSSARAQSQAGFTLLEMVVVIGVIASLIGSFLAFYQPLQKQQADALTKVRMERVMNALSSYALLNNRIPCPFSPNDTVTIGQEATSGSCTDPGWGLVPYVTLGLTQEDVTDGYGRYITYVMAKNLYTAPGGAADATTSRFCTVSGTRLIIRRPTYNETGVAVALIAYGSDGFGSFSMNSTNPGSRLCPLGSSSCSNNNNLNSLLGTNGIARERDNAVDTRGNGLFFVNIADYTPQKGVNHFDDTVIYATGPGLISRLGVTGCH